MSADLDYHNFTVLVVDDEPDILRTFALSYGRDFRILTVADGSGALELLQSEDAAVIVADQRMPGMTGAEFLERSMAARPDAVRIILTGYTDNEALVHAINKSRIYRYVTKPWETEELRMALCRAIEAFHLTRENARLMEELRRANERLAADNAYLRESAGVAAQELVGDSAAMGEVRRLIGKVAGSDSTVLIEGETGTGKELVARAIHVASLRSTRLFVAVNCAELSEGVLESELFGHRRGAFTGASSDRKGLFEVADGGSLFLDEISEITPTLQAKLLRVLQEGEIRPVGETRPRPVDVRIIAATNRRLEEEVQAGRFRADLFYRLRVFPIPISPLRERSEDIPVLARHLAHRLARRMKKPVGDLTPEALHLLGGWAFPGNVRELANEIERAILLAEPGAPLGAELFSEDVQGAARTGEPITVLHSRTASFERDQIRAALSRASGVKTHAAEELGISYRGLLKKMRRLGLSA